MPGSLFIRFNNAIVFPEPEPTINNIRHGWPENFGYFGLMFFSVFFYNVIKIKHFCIFL